MPPPTQRVRQPYSIDSLVGKKETPRSSPNRQHAPFHAQPPASRDSPSHPDSTTSPPPSAVASSETTHGAIAPHPPPQPALPAPTYPRDVIS